MCDKAALRAYHFTSLTYWRHVPGCIQGAFLRLTVQSYMDWSALGCCTIDYLSCYFSLCMQLGLVYGLGIGHVDVLLLYIYDILLYI